LSVRRHPVRVPLPHRFPFRLVDRRGDGARALLSADSFWLRGGRALDLPLLAEAAAQAAAELLPESASNGEEMVLAALSECELKRQPRAGETLEFELSIAARFGSTVRVDATIRATDPSAEVARMTLTLARPAG